MVRRKSILVTGAGGYIGSITSYYLLKAGFKIIALDNFSTGFMKPLKLLEKLFGKSRIKIQNVDLTTSANFVKKPSRIDAVIHFAGVCSVDESFKNPSKYFKNNITGSQNLLERIINSNIKFLIFSSSCTVYGNTNVRQINEKHQTSPESPYGFSKRVVEQMIEFYKKTNNVNYMILRYFNVCGASRDGKFGDSKRPSVHLIQNLVRSAINHKPFFLTFNKKNQRDRGPVRDYVDVVDLAEAHVKALKHLLRGGESGVVNIGTGHGDAVLDIVEKVSKISKANIPIKQSRSRKGESSSAVASNKKAAKILGWKPKRKLEDSIKTLIMWYKSNPDGWEY